MIRTRSLHLRSTEDMPSGNMIRKLKRKYWYPISVDIERLLRRWRCHLDRAYRKKWPIVFAFFIMFQLGAVLPLVIQDYDRLENYAHFDALNEGVYSSWRTDGLPGQDPPTK